MRKMRLIKVMYCHTYDGKRSFLSENYKINKIIFKWVNMMSERRIFWKGKKTAKSSPDEIIRTTSPFLIKKLTSMTGSSSSRILKQKFTYTQKYINESHHSAADHEHVGPSANSLKCVVRIKDEVGIKGVLATDLLGRSGNFKFTNFASMKKIFFPLSFPLTLLWTFGFLDPCSFPNRISSPREEIKNKSCCCSFSCPSLKLDFFVI